MFSKGGRRSCPPPPLRACFAAFLLTTPSRGRCVLFSNCGRRSCLPPPLRACDAAFLLMIPFRGRHILFSNGGRRSCSPPLLRSRVAARSSARPRRPTLALAILGYFWRFLQFLLVVPLATPPRSVSPPSNSLPNSRSRSTLLFRPRRAVAVRTWKSYFWFCFFAFSNFLSCYISVCEVVEIRFPAAGLHGLASIRV